MDWGMRLGQFLSFRSPCPLTLERANSDTLNKIRLQR